MSNRISPALLVASALALAGCDPWVVGDGVFKEETRTTGAFVGVSVQDGLEVEATGGAVAHSVKVSGDQNVLEHIVTEVVNEAGLGATLIVKSDVTHIESTHPLRVSVAVPVLSHARAVENAVLEVKGAAAEIFDVHAGDGAEVELSGTGGDHLLVTLWGGSKGGATLDARSYVAGDATVALTGGAVAELHVDGPVTGTVAEGSSLVNVGEGTCAAVVLSSGGQKQCAP